MEKIVGWPTARIRFKPSERSRFPEIRLIWSLAVFLTTVLTWAPMAFGCPAEWVSYKAHLRLFGVGAGWADPVGHRTLSAEETLRGWGELLETEDYEALRTLVYDVTLEQLATLRTLAEAGLQSGPGMENPAAAALVRDRRLDVLDYLIFLRRFPIVVSSQNAWGYKPEQPADWQISRDESAYAIAEKAARSDLPEALRRRYIYQMFNYGFRVNIPEYNEQLKKIFAGEVAAWPDDEPVKQWCRSYYAGLLFKDGDLTGAFKEYALVYAHSWRCQERAHESLHLIVQKDADVGLKTLERTDLTEAEREAVQKVINSFNSDLEEILAASEEKGWPLPNDFNQRLIAFLNAENDRRLSAQAPAVPEPRSSLEKVLAAAADVHPDQVTLRLAAANLAIHRGDAAEARGHLRKADRADVKRTYEAQRIVLETLNRAYLQPLHDRGEADLFKHLSWLVEHGGQNWQLPFDYGRKTKLAGEAERIDGALRALLWTILPDRYTAQGRDDRAALILGLLDDPEKVKPYQSSFPFWKLIQSPPGRLCALADTLENPRTPFEKFLVKSVGWTPDYPLELTGSYYIRTHRFDQAIRVLALIPEDRRRSWVAGSSNWYFRGRSTSTSGARDPFDDPFLYGPDHERNVWRKAMLDEALNHGLSAEDRQTLIRLTETPAGRLEFAIQMKELEELGHRPGEPGALALYCYAQALYNISWHGLSWRMSAWGRHLYEPEYVAGLDLSFSAPYYWLYAQWRRYAAFDPVDQYHYPSAVVKILNRAVHKTDNQELKARLELMSAAMPPSDRNWWREYRKQDYKHQNSQDQQWYEVRKKNLRGLAAQYKDTDFIRQARESCPLLKEFL
jgi:hypothetical protein